MNKIVIVDNDKVSVEALSNILMQEGYAVFKAYDGVEGPKIMKTRLVPPNSGKGQFERPLWSERRKGAPYV